MRPDLACMPSGYQCDVVTKNPNYNGMLYEEKGRRILAHTGEKVTVDEQGRSQITGKMPEGIAAGEWQYRVLCAATITSTDRWAPDCGPD